MKHSTPPKCGYRGDNSTDENYSYEQMDNIPSIDARWSKDNILNDIRIDSEMVNDVSGVVNSPTRNEMRGSAGCNITHVTMTDANDIIIPPDDETVDMNKGHMSDITEDKTITGTDTMSKSNRRSWSKSIAMYGTINSIPAFILFDSGAEGIFINEAFIQKHTMKTEQSDSNRIGVMADGTTRDISQTIRNANIHIQSYNDNLDMHVLPIA